MSTISFDMDFYFLSPNNIQNLIDTVCNYFIKRGYVYDNDRGYWLDSKSDFINGTIQEAKNAFSNDNGSMLFHSKSYSIIFLEEKGQIVQDPLSVEIRFNLIEGIFKEAGSISLSVHRTYIYDRDKPESEPFPIRPEFIKEIDAIIKDIWELTKPAYGHGGRDDINSEYQPTKLDIMRLHVPLLFPVNLFNKFIVDSITEKKIIQCGAEILYKFPDGSYMIWPTSNPMTGDSPNKIKPIEQALGIKHEKWIYGRRL